MCLVVVTLVILLFIGTIVIMPAAVRTVAAWNLKLKKKREQRKVAKISSGVMKWFGQKPWGPICETTERVPTPVNEPCWYCGEKIEGSDNGVLMPTMVSLDGPWRDEPNHRECFLRQIFGSLAHQMRTCSCFNETSEEGDPEGLSRRESAKLVEIWLTKHIPNIAPQC